MHLLGQRTLGIGMLLLLSMLVITKQLATGSIMKDKPKGSLWVWLTHIFNLSFLLILNPLAAVLLVTRQLEAVDPTHVFIDNRWLLMGLEASGLGLYVIGTLLLIWALARLRGNYQAGGSAPRTEDRMIFAGPYQFIRHPMYTAALSISLGLACMVQSLAFLSVFGIYLVLIIMLIPIEEQGLRRAYGSDYAAYQQKTGRLIPFVY